MSFRSLGLLTVLAAVLCIGSTAGADTITLQDGFTNPLTGSLYAGTGDNMLRWLSHTAPPNLGQHQFRNYGAATYFTTGIGDDGDTSRTFKHKSVIRFDFTSLEGKYASIDSVKLRLFPTAGDVSFANNLRLFRFTTANGDWVEGTKDNVIQTGSSCWDYRAYNTTSWASGVAGTDPADYVGGIGGYIASTAFSSVPVDWMDLVFTDLSFIDDWVAGTNSGMVLRVGDESKYSTLTFHSSDAAVADAQYRPQLVIGYTPIPEPSTLALLATGLIGLLCYAWRKRK